MFSILNEIKNNSHFRTTAVVVASIGSACFVYLLVAITGYLSYGSNVQGNIVSMYPPAVASTIGRAAIVILVMFSYPLQVHPCRASVDAVSKWRPARRSPPSATQVSASSSPSRQGPPATQPGKGEMSDIRFAFLTSAIIIASYLVAMTVSSLEAVLAYVGSTGSTSISFILPGLFYYKISSPDSPAHQKLMKDQDWAGSDDEYDGANDGEEEDDEEHGEGNPLLQSSIASMNSLTRRARRTVKRVWPKGMLRKLSLALAIYGFCVMVVCLGTNIYMHSQGRR
jgi:hypothetical protein